MNLQECPRARRVRALLVIFLACMVALAASCTSPEKAKALHLQQGEDLLKQRRWQEASIEFRNALQIDENLAAAHWGLAQAYEQLERGNEYIMELQSTVKLDPNNMTARLKLANGYILGYASQQQKNPELLQEAGRLANEIVAHDPKNPDGKILLANVSFLLGKDGPKAEEVTKQAEIMIRDAIALDPQRIESYMGLANFFLLANRQADAEAVYKKAISVNDRASLAHVEYGRFLVKAGRAPEAESEFIKATEVDPENRDVRWVLASYYLINNRLDKAEEGYKAWAHLDWDNIPDGRARLADYYATVGRFDEAASLYQEIVNKFPDYARAHYRLGEISLQRGDTQSASAQVDELLKRNPKDIDALFLRARMESASGQYTKAIADLKTVLEADPHSKLGLYFMSDALYRDGQYEQARARAGDLERYYPDFMPAKLIQMQIALDSGDAIGAKRMGDELLKKLQEKTPGGDMTPQLLAEAKLNALLLRGKASLALSHSVAGADAAKLVAGARTDFDAARQGVPNSPLPYVNLADAAAAENKPDEAQQQIEHALSIDRTNFQALTALINLETVTGKLDEARARVEQLANEQPNNPQLQYLVGEAYRHGNPAQAPDAQRAEAAYQRAIEAAKGNYIPAYNALAEIYVGTNQPDRAIDSYKKIVEQRPDDFVAIRNIGLVEAGRGQLDVAADYYRRVLSIRSDEPVAENNLAALYGDHDKGNAEEAMRLAQDVVRRYPNEPGFADTLGWVYYKKGLYRDAVEQLQRAVTLASKRNADNSLYRWHLGAALASDGKKADARRELQKCQELYALEQQRTPKPPTSTPIEDVRRTIESL